MSLPTISRQQDVLPGLKLWQQRLNGVVKRIVRLRAVFNFKATTSTALANSVFLEWEPLKDADGYIIERSDSGDFSVPVRLPLIKGGNAASFLDNVGATGLTKFYRIIATSGTVREPHAVEGIPSAVISATSNSNATSYDQGSDDGWSTGSENPFRDLLVEA